MTFEELGIKTRSGQARYYTTCPKCNDSRQHHKGARCLTVNDEPGNRWFKCHHCNYSGNLDLMDRFNQVLEKSKMPKQQAKIYSKEVSEYLLSRGLDPSILIREGVFEYSVQGNPIMSFPFYINKTLVNVKYFNLRWEQEEKGLKWWRMKKELGALSIFMGMQSISFERNEEIDKVRYVIITEGEWDWLTWKQCGYNNSLSVPQGAPNPNTRDFKSEFEYIEDPYVKSFFHPDNIDLIIFSTDNDDPGRLLRNHLALCFGRERCKFINYPVGYKDINEVFAGSKKKNLPALGKKGVDDCFYNLSSFPVKGIISPRDVQEELEKLASDGFTPGFGCGIGYIDELYTLKPKHITFVTGAPGSGKSVYIRWYLSEFVRNNIDFGLKWAMFTPENRPVSREHAKIAEVLTGQSFKRGYQNSMSEEVRRKTLNFIERYFYVISPDRKNFESWGNKIKSDSVNTLESLLQYLIYLKKTENIFGYVIDAWNKIEHEQPKYMTETSYISQQLDMLINFNDTYDVHGIIIVHPRKLELGPDMNYKMPSLYDIKGSSAWKEKADIGILVHRNKMRKRKKSEFPDDVDEDDRFEVNPWAPTIIRTEKIRFEELGKEDRVKLVMNTKKGGRFELYKEEKKNIPSPDSRIESNKDDDDFQVGIGSNEEGNDLPF